MQIESVARGLGAAVGLFLFTACVDQGGAADGAAEAALAQAGPACDILQANAPLPADLPEASGIAASETHEGVLWAHNDSGEPFVFALRSAGEGLGRTRVQGAEVRDWEDIAVGPCPTGSCLYIADIGDNGAERDEVRVYRVPEPAPGAAATAPAESFSFRYPQGPGDAESLFVLPSGELFVVTKGRTAPPTLFRYPGTLRAGEVVTLDPVATLTPGMPAPRDLVTGAAATADGVWIAVRTYRAVGLYRAHDLLRGHTAPAHLADLNPVGEIQGEGIAIHPDGTVVLTSEGVFESTPGTISVLSCALGE